ncbi:MAG: UDP-3-O-(3-hydroxymyristoyl)glucosamine N-acyltransferase [Prevotella sp.]|jgi:UDP-3-O-[3-hydroxymyristoyl] glucosamine N-acyltransferase
MEFTARQIADFIKGRIVGDENASVHTFSKIEEGSAGAITFLSSPKYAHYLDNTKASIVLVDDTIAVDKEVKPTLIFVKNVRDCIARLLQLYANSIPQKKGISEQAFISPNAKIGKDAYVGPFAVISDGAEIGDNAQIYPNVYVGEGVKIGNNVKLYPNVVIYHGCRIGNNVTLHAGTVIGADGFGFAPTPNGYDKIPQIGIVTIEDDVEIGANTCVDRSTMGSTYIRKGVKLDNLVQIAHNVDVGANTVMSAQVGIAGSTKVGQWCMFGGQTGISGHITIGDKVFLGAQSGVPSSLKSNQQLIGTPPMEKIPYFKSQALFQKLPELYKQISQLQKEIDELKKNQK